MYKKSKTAFIVGGILTAAAVIFTILVCRVDVRQIGVENTNVGFAGINGPFHEWTGIRMPWYTVSKVLGIICLAVAGMTMLLGLIQMIQRKSLIKVDACILCTGVLYITVAILYVLFDRIPINYRPVTQIEGLEQSYPSTHTLIACCVMYAAMVQVKRIFSDKKTRRILRVAFALIMAATIAARTLSGFHWLTDIIGGVLISAALCAIFRGCVWQWEYTRWNKRHGK